MSTLRVEALEQPDGTAFVFNNKNLLINGGMNVWQRSTSTSVNSDVYSTVDRFKTRVRGGAAYTISRSTDVPSAQGFGYSLKFDNTTADASPTSNDFTLLEQRIEGQNLQHLLKGTSSAKSLTLSFWIKSNLTGTFIARLYDSDNARSISKSYTISSANTWEKKEITFDGDTTGVLDNDNNGSLWLQLWFSAGPDFTSTPLESTWGSTDTTRIAAGISNLSSSTSNELYITGIQLEVGSTASGFEFEPYVATLQKCLRYYRKITTDLSGRRFRQGGVATATTNVSFDMLMSTPMRALPSMTKANIELRNLSDTATAGAINAIFADDEFLLIGFSVATTGAISDGYSIRATSSSAKLDFDSEL